MIDVALSIEPAGDVIALDVWEGEPNLDGLRALKVEPRRWWLIGAAAQAEALAATLGDNGTLAPIGGGLVRATLIGPGWRELLTVSGIFDAEDPGFGPGGVAGTVIHHVAVRIAPISATSCEVYFASSYAPSLIELWQRAIGVAARHAAPVTSP